MTEASQQALNILRSTEHFQWHVIPLLAFVLYVYIAEVQKKNWHIVLAGLIYYSAEFCWEMLNALLLHFTQYAALWSAPADTAYLILVGLNIEISMMFAVAGVIVLKSLPEDKKLKIWGIPNRILIPVAWGLFCAFVEILLNRCGALVWDYKFWSWPHVYIIIVAYTVPFLGIVWVYDRLSIKTKLQVLYFLIAIDVLMWFLFVLILKWI